MAVIDVRDCADFIYRALVREMDERGKAPGVEWIENERVAVAIAANQWAQAHRLRRSVGVDDVQRIEHQAVGHVDYARKLALYVAELLIGDEA